MKILVTGCAGFIGYHVCLKLLQNNKKYHVFGIDNMNNYYDVKLKFDRIKILKKYKNFKYYKLDIEKKNLINKNFLFNKYNIVIHLAAQAGVRYSIEKPEKYIDANIVGFFNILDESRKIRVDHFIYASSSSVYGNNKNFPLNENENTDKPLSMYAATKKSNEVISYSYSNIFNLPTTGLRFFTVYGTLGRPDMSLYKFVNNTLKNKFSEVYNYGNHERDFTHVDDVTKIIIKLLHRPSKKSIPYQIFNIGSNSPKKLIHFIRLIEKIIGKRMKIKFKKLQDGDVKKTHADITRIQKKYGYEPKKSINEGIAEFVNWFKKRN